MKPAAQDGQLMLSMGALLASERERRGIAVEKAAKETRMRPQRIRDMEADDLSHFSNPSYARMFIIAYAKYLGIPMPTIHEHLPDRGEPGTEGYQYINAAPDELPSLRRDLVSRPLRRNGWLPAVIVVSLLALVAAVGFGVFYLTVTLPRIVSSGEVAKRPVEPEAEPAPMVVTRTVFLEMVPHLDNLPAPTPRSVDPIAPTAPVAASPLPLFTAAAQIAAPPRPTPIVVIGTAPSEQPTTLETAVPTASPEEDDRSFLLGSSPDQTIPAN